MSPSASVTPVLYLVPICNTLSLGGTFRNAWAAPYLTDVLGDDSANVGFILTIISLVGIGTSFLLPMLLTYYRARTLVRVTYIFGVGWTIMLAWAPGWSLPVACTGLSVIYAMGNVHPVIMTEAQARIPHSQHGIVLGALNTLVFLGVSVASTTFGEIAGLSLPEPTTYRLVFGVTAGALAIALVVYWLAAPLTTLIARFRSSVR